MGRVLATADIGSNTAHLLIAELGRTNLKRMVNESEWLSLGEVVSREGCIPKEAEDRLVETLTRFKRLADGAKAQSLYVFATEAMRRASNCDDVLKRIKKECGIEVDIVSPRREAELGLRGALQDTKPTNPVLMIETGGGSVQAAYCHNNVITEEVSLRIGTGVLIAKSNLQFPAAKPMVNKIKSVVDEALEALNIMPPAASAIACGGVARGIWRALHPDGEKTIFRKELEFLAWDTQRLSEEQIVARYSVKPKRAQTLLPGSLIYLAMLEKIGIDEITVSQYGVREGAVMEIAGQK